MAGDVRLAPLLPRILFCALGAVIGPGASCWPAVCVDTDEPGRICVGLEGKIGRRMLGALGWMLAGISIPALALGA